MGKKIFANGMEIAHKAGDGKVIAAFPDVCLSPPSPPAGPVPIPYPNTSKAADLQEGSKTVLLGGKPAALKDQSYYKTSPLGDEAATRTFGANVLNHGITGKTYFRAFSMDVAFEGLSVARHLDITTSNHASEPPGEGAPMPNAEGMDTAAAAKVDEKLCDCCGGPLHSEAQRRAAMTSDQFYNPPSARNKRDVAAVKFAGELRKDAKDDGCGSLLHENDSDPCAQHFPTSAAENKAARQEYAAMMSPMTPDEYFTERYGPKLGPEIQARGKQLTEKLKSGSKSIAHKTPLCGGGCPVGAGNLQPVNDPCDLYESGLGDAQGQIAQVHRAANGLGK